MTVISPVVVDSPPFADLYISGLPAGTARIEVVRSWRGVLRRVRGDSITPVLGTDARLVDWALPVSLDGAEVTYSVQALSASGAVIEAAASVSVATPRVTHSQAWVSDPHDPITAIRVGVLASESDESADSSVTTVSTLVGMPVAINAPRTSRSRAWRLSADDAVTVARMDRILGVGSDPTQIGTGLLLIRGDASCLDHATGSLHVTAPTVTRQRLLPHRPRVTYAWSGVETRGPMAPPVVSRRTYQDDLDENPTYADSLAAYPTYLDRARAGL